MFPSTEFARHEVTCRSCANKMRFNDRWSINLAKHEMRD